MKPIKQVGIAQTHGDYLSQLKNYEQERDAFLSHSVSRTAVVAVEVCTFTVRLRMQKNPRVFGNFYFFGERAEFDFYATGSEQDGARRKVA
jgi:hypothetical protein